MVPESSESMIILEFEGIEIDYCVESGSIWLDSGELEQLASLAGVESGRLTRALGQERGRSGGGKKCPRCGKVLDIVTLADVGGLEIDRCPRGHGLWFDRGELQTLVAAFEEGEEGVVARFFARMFENDLEPSSGQ